MRVHAYYYLRVSARVAPGPRESPLVANARIAGATPLFEWIADDAAAVFSY